MNCDLCGKVEENLARTLIEGVELEVCPACSKFGKAVSQPKRLSPKEQHMQFQNKSEPRRQEKIEMIVENYAELIKKKRESIGLSQKDFALKISEKDSTIHHIETGTFEPPMALAKKLERFLGIKLVEHHEESPGHLDKKSKEGGFTLGDFIRNKK